MINEDYCSYEVAKLLKEKGCDYPNLHGIDSDRDNIWIKITHQMAMQWLREYGIFIEISVSMDLNGSYHYNYSVLNEKCEYARKGCTSPEWRYEDAVEAALTYSLENLI